MYGILIRTILVRILVRILLRTILARTALCTGFIHCRVSVFAFLNCVPDEWEATCFL